MSDTTTSESPRKLLEAALGACGGGAPAGRLIAERALDTWQGRRLLDLAHRGLRCEADAENDVQSLRDELAAVKALADRYEHRLTMIHNALGADIDADHEPVDDTGTPARAHLDGCVLDADHDGPCDYVGAEIVCSEWCMVGSGYRAVCSLPAGHPEPHTHVGVPEVMWR